MGEQADYLIEEGLMNWSSDQLHDVSRSLRRRRLVAPTGDADVLSMNDLASLLAQTENED